jgi:hypothetical protein
LERRRGMNNPLEMFMTNEDGKRVITLEGLQKLSEYEPYFVIPKEANPKIVETATGDYDIVYDKNYPILVEWRRKGGQK